ncbi:DNA polymerase [Marinomonas phage CPP1m]|uniref:DNA polymerase n=2 Tax=Murciavirus CPP1m TaxID=2733327 RepID=A0A1W5S342_9CAUD|nr:DNA polymerase [Marinomonas phage CPP1m]ARB11237.1 DNA polymerase [Marinomonas phage CPP1m]ARB11287.1 DNA polymerase [Marinomonas phage CPG1g]
MSLGTYPSMYDGTKDRRESVDGRGRFLCADMEGVGFLNELRYDDPSSMHVINIHDMFTKEVYTFFDPYEKRDPDAREELVNEGYQDGYLLDGIKMLMEAEAIVFQNGVGYDMPAFEKVFPNDWKFNYSERRGKDAVYSNYFPYKLMDTMLISQLLNPDRKAPSQAFAMGLGNVGPHTIEAHGIRIGRYKPSNEDWSKLTDHMIHRCEEDTGIGKDFFYWLMNNEWADHLRRGRNKVSGKGIIEAYEMELKVALYISKQEDRGFRLDMLQGWKEYNDIGKEMDDIFNKIDPLIPKRVSTEPLNMGRIVKICNAFSKSYPNESNGFLAKMLKEHMLTPDARVGKRAAVWKLTKASGDYSAAVKSNYPEMVGNINDTEDPLVQGAFTPIDWDEIGLGNLEYIKEKVLYPKGWRGVNFSDSEQKWIDNAKENPEGELSSPWAGKIDEASLEAWRVRVPDLPEFFSEIVQWYVLRSRRSQILNPKDMDYYSKNKQFPKQKDGKRHCKGLMAKAFSKEHNMEAWEYFEKMGEFPSDPSEEWRVPAAAFSIGTNTFRMRHKYVVNIPSRGLRPLRHLFIAGNGKKVLGCDGAGLELRMLAHFMNDAIYTEVVLNGDIHTYNQELAGLPIRDMAKTFIYAFLYGSGISNLAKVCGLSEEEMRKRVNRFKKELPALANLIAACEKAGEAYGYLHGIDGRWGRIRKSGRNILLHTVLNVLLQMTGSLCMKYGLVLGAEKMQKEGVGLDEQGHPMFVANVHDEVQMEVEADEVEYMDYTVLKADWKAEEKREHFDDQGRMWSAPSILGEDEIGEGVLTVGRAYHRAGAILAETMRETGEMLNLRIPLAGEYKIGDSWKDTH